MSAKVILTKLVNAVTKEEFIPPAPVDVSEFFYIDDANLSVDYHHLTFDEISQVWGGLPTSLADIPAAKLVSHVNIQV